MKRVYIMLLISLLFILAGCSGKMGYGVVLWSIPEHNLHDGDIVPVYVRSNIGKVYIIGIPGSKEKLEVPLWQISEPESKRTAQKTASYYAEYRRHYARAALDGLPIRAEPVNTAKQVYRLRHNEVIKILYKGEGQAVMMGKTPLEGEWLRVLTADGSRGWCFSYNLRLFDETKTDAGIAEEIEEKDAVLEKVLAKRWVPDFYKGIIDSGKIDLERIKPEYGFDTGSESGFVSISLEGLSTSEEFQGAKKTGINTYTFTQTPFTMTVQSEDTIVVQYVGKNGLPVSYGFVSLEKSGIPQFLSLNRLTENDIPRENDIPTETDTSFTPAADEDSDTEQKSTAQFINELIAYERGRRLRQYSTLVSYGPVFVSSNYGTLTLNEDQSFTWTGFRLLLNSGILPQSLSRSNTGRGSASIKYFIAGELERQFDGVLTFSFTGADAEVSFLYKMEETGLRLENIANGSVKKSTVNNRSINPLVLFFAKR
ncbi:SH3 domain-containing protein [Treponema sp. OMZ 840]|uniref:SH3 domain-containing protein n=1 Tax=Treponema sp. OMZ 840 TaxID=244313 RepID=UPI003D8A371B